MCNLESIGIYLGEHCPRLWGVIGQYKNVAKCLTILVVLLQLVRIVFVTYEWKFINTEYPQTETIAFCFLSILLGFISLGLESLLLFAIQTNNLKKIQPWFLCTFLIFLVASLAFVITSTLYIIRPIDHNAHLALLKSQSEVKESLQRSSTTPAPANRSISAIVNGTLGVKQNASNPSPSLAMDAYDYMMEESVSGSSTSTEPGVGLNGEECSLNGTCKYVTVAEKNATTKWRRAINGIRTNSTNEIFNSEDEEESEILAMPTLSREFPNKSNNTTSSDENGSFMSSPGGVCTTSNKTAAVARAAATKAKRRKGVNYITRAHNEIHTVHPIVPLSYLLDVLRCIPQLFLVNRFVKSEQLHEHLIHPSHSHTSLSALYVKPLPVLV